MPFKSYRQFRFLMAKHPEIAKKWIREGYPVPHKPKNYRAQNKKRALSAHTDPVALKALKRIAGR